MQSKFAYILIFFACFVYVQKKGIIFTIVFYIA